ncbi:MAG: endonuclease/exonuclease/phosphatase family protein [Myxococcota bacterium]|nr:endonuclease/exonuclease/phosphatase family protein [Myxococcota bacterium]
MPRLLLLCWTLALAGCDSLLFRTGFDDVEDAVLYTAKTLTEAPESADQVLVINHNIKYGGARLLFFWECGGTRYNMTEGEVKGHLDAVIELINATEPDILMLQEVDVLSQRSAYIDQVQYILDRTHLNYGAYASQHKSDFLPSDGMGKMDFGNATLSRWPIAEATRYALPLVSEYPAYYQYFYLKRHILDATIELPGNPNFHVVNTHLEAFSDDGTKRRQIDQFHGHLTDLHDDGVDFIAGGDLNSLPAGSQVLKNFDGECPDEARFEGDNYEGEEDWLDDLFADFNSLMPLDEYAEDNGPWHSYAGDPDIGWNRTLDYLFTNGTWLEGEVMQSEAQGGHTTIHLSDHAPIRAIWEAGQ